MYFENPARQPTIKLHSRNYSRDHYYEII